MQPIPIGMSNFKVLKDDNNYYIDKTINIKEFLNLSGKVTILARPRRFGKTLFQSTLYYFFSNSEKDENLFKDTKIYQDKEFFNTHFGKYPVIFLTLKDLREPTFDRFIENLSYLIRGAFSVYRHIDTDKLDIQRTFSDQNPHKPLV